MKTELAVTSLNEAYLRRKQKVMLNPKRITKEPATSRRYLATMMQNVNALGYTFSKQLTDELQNLPTDELETFYFEIVGILRKLVGADKTYRPMYPNFPQQVMDASECELFFNAIIHYWSGGQLLPDYEKEERFPLLDQTKLKEIDLGDFDNYAGMLRNLLASKTSISASDKEDIENYILSSESKGIAYILPEEVPMKENVAFIANLMLQDPNGKFEVTVRILSEEFIQTATDVLRLAVAMSEGDVSLATKVKFRSFKQKERKLIMELLNKCSNIEEDMVRYREEWLRVGERIHPSEFNNGFIKVKQAFDKLRKDIKIKTFGSKVRKATDEGNVIDAVAILTGRPGEFARKLDHLLRMGDPELTLTEFALVAHQVAVPVLLQAMKHFRHRAYEISMIRSFFPKGAVSKVWTTENKLPELSADVCNRVVKICMNSLIEIFKSRPSLGKVFIDTALRDHLVPFSQRSASKALKTYVRGSKIQLDPDLNTIRVFIWWRNLEEGGRSYPVDLDLSMTVYDENWEYVDHLSYTQLRSSGMGWHSGDITNAPNGASEFIDLDLSRVHETKGRFAVMQVYSYSQTPFVDLPECYMGWMERQHPNSGEIYEPSTVVNKADLTVDTKIAVPIVIDVKEMKVIWTDLAIRHEGMFNNVESNKLSVASMARALHEIIKPSLYELFELHCAARGSLCDSADEADTIFSLEKGITPFDVDVIISQYL